MLQHLITIAAAGGKPAPSGAGGLLYTMGPMLLIFVIMYLLLIRPQQKKANEHRQMVNRLKVGDKVMTNGGIFGSVTAVSETKLKLRIAEKVEIEVIRSAVANIVESKAE